MKMMPRLLSAKHVVGGFPQAVIGMGLVVPLLCACNSVTYDLRDLQHPVVLNENPFLARAGVATPALTNVDTYKATVSKNVTGSYGSGSFSLANEAEVNASHKIGGQQNRTIRNLALEAKYSAFFVLIAMGDTITIDATGTVSEFQPPGGVTALEVGNLTPRTPSEVKTNTTAGSTESAAQPKAKNP